MKVAIFCIVLPAMLYAFPSVDSDEEYFTSSDSSSGSETVPEPMPVPMFVGGKECKADELCRNGEDDPFPIYNRCYVVTIDNFYRGEDPIPLESECAKILYSCDMKNKGHIVTAFIPVFPPRAPCPEIDDDDI